VDSAQAFDGLRHIGGLLEQLAPLGVKSKDPPALLVAAAEFVLEGLYAHRRIGRNEERVFTAGEKAARRVEVSPPEPTDEPPVRRRRPYN
jgi:magnesium chelatase subunit I